MWGKLPSKLRSPECCGLIREMAVSGNEKVGDVESRKEQSCNAISDKAMAIGGGVLEQSCTFFTLKICSATLGQLTLKYLPP